MGVTNCDIRADRINLLEYDMGGYKSAYNYILSRKGTYIADSSDSSRIGSAFGEPGDPAQQGPELVPANASGTLETITNGSGEAIYQIRVAVGTEESENQWSNTFAVKKSEPLEEMWRNVAMLSAVSVIGIAFLVFLVVFIIQRALRPVEPIMKLARNMEAGLLSTRVEVNADNELGELAGIFHSTSATLGSYVEEISEVLGEIARGNLSLQIKQNYMGDFKPIKGSLDKILAGLNQTLLTISTAAEEVNTGASQVSSGAQALAAGAAEQAATVEELSHSLTQVAEQAQNNMEHVRTASHCARLAGEDIAAGNRHMEELTDAMSHIDSASGQIASISKTIEDIAFQTNILALNAAVETARAGASGKGFAVVADEVRNLATKSAEAAKQASQLVERSIASVAEGSQITDQTARVLQSAQRKAKEMDESILQIEQASFKQTDSIEQIRQGLSQVSAVVQTNAATAEENSATSEEMSSQAAMLHKEVGRFTLNS
ncbi:methyl-accepting chemotaxis protein [Lachnospiraceae bacterium 54-53]